MIYQEGWHCEVRDELARTSKRIFIYRVISSQEIEVLGADMVPRVVGRHTATEPEPTVILPEEAFQALVDNLQNRKPTEAKYTEGKLEATERHLTDMRKLLKLT